MKNIYATLALSLLMLQFGNLDGQEVYYWEQFNGNDNGWTSERVAPDTTFANWQNVKWGWSPNGSPDSGIFWNTVTPIASESSSNGSMIFNADFITTQGIPANLPPPPYVPFICHLISPPIDLTGIDPTLYLQLQFTQFVRYFNTSPNAPGNLRISLSWSTDDGMTWSDHADLSNNVPDANQAVNGNIVKIGLPYGIQADNSEVRFRFTWASQFYFWVIDDVKITQRPDNDMRVNSNWYAVAPNLRWPLSMAESFSFLADIENLGVLDQTGVNLNISIKNPSNAEVYAQNLAYGTITSDSLAENQPFPGDGFLPTDLIQYTGTYTVSADNSDDDLSNNTQSFTFTMTDTLFAKENGPTTGLRPGSGSWDPGEPWSWGCGNYFYVPAAGNNFFSYMTFAVDAAAAFAGDDLLLRIYEWQDNGDEIAAANERVAVATMIHTLTGTETRANPISVPVQTLTGDPVPLKDDTHYLAVIEYQTDKIDNSIFIGFSRAVDYGAMVMRSGMAEKPRYAAVIAVEGTLDAASYFTAFFGGSGNNTIPVVRLSIKEVNNTKEALNPAETVKIYPNPANDFTQFDVKLKETSSRITVQLLDMTGRVLQTQQFQNQKEVTSSFDTARLANGTYLVRIETDHGYATELLAVQK